MPNRCCVPGCRGNYDSIEVEDIHDLISEVYLNDNEANVLVFIAGYVAHVVIKHLKCNFCKSRLCYDKNLEVEFSATKDTEYLVHIDRGGLKWPSQFTLG